MDGQTLKNKLSVLGMTAKDIADKIGMSPQALNTIFKVQDIKTGTLEKMCSALNIDMSFFYPCSGTITNTNIQANHATGNIAGGNQTIEESKALLDIIRQQQETINKLILSKQ